jgi:RimJ/RimL family protein N-acetyltransferase
MKDKAVFLEGKNIYLRPLDMDDLETFYVWFNNPDLRQYLLLPFPITKAGEQDFLEKAMRDENNVILSIIVKKGDKLIGNIGLHQMHTPVNKVSKRAMLGIAIGDLEEASKGFGTEAIKLMLDYGFNSLNLHRIELTVFDFNERAFKAYKKIGFKEEGTKREALYLKGKYHDLIMMAILKKEWKKA